MRYQSVKSLDVGYIIIASKEGSKAVAGSGTERRVGNYILKSVVDQWEDILELFGIRARLFSIAIADEIISTVSDVWILSEYRLRENQHGKTIREWMSGHDRIMSHFFRVEVSHNVNGIVGSNESSQKVISVQRKGCSGLVA